MLKQAIERQSIYDIHNLDIRSKLRIIQFFFAIFGTSFSIVEKQPFLLGINAYLLCSSIKSHIQDESKLKELKKYKMFLELLDNLDEINLQAEKNVLPLGIDTLDEFSYSEVKGWYKYYKKEKQLKKII